MCVLLCVVLRGCLESGLEVLLRATGRSLVELTVTNCPNILTDRCVWLASCYCRSLQTLTYRCVYVSGCVCVCMEVDVCVCKWMCVCVSMEVNVFLWK